MAPTPVLGVCRFRSELRSSGPKANPSEVSDRERSRSSAREALPALETRLLRVSRFIVQPSLVGSIIPEPRTRSFSSQLPSELTKESKPVDPWDPVIRAGVRNLERCRRCAPGALAGDYRAVSHTRESDHERISAPSLGFLVDQPWARSDHLSDGPHLRIVERREKPSPATEQGGQDILSPLELLENLIRRNEIARSNGSIEPPPEGQEYVWRMVSADVDPDTGINYVRRRHALSRRTDTLDSPGDVIQMLQTDAEVLADVRESDPLSIKRLQDETCVSSSVVPHHNPKERREALALSRSARKGLVLGQVLPSLAFVELVGRAAQDQQAA